MPPTKSTHTREDSRVLRYIQSVFVFVLVVGFDSYGRVLLDKNALGAGADIPAVGWLSVRSVL
jgi:hypothetical protein